MLWHVGGDTSTCLAITDIILSCYGFWSKPNIEVFRLVRKFLAHSDRKVESKYPIHDLKYPILELEFNFNSQPYCEVWMGKSFTFTWNSQWRGLILKWLDFGCKNVSNVLNHTFIMKAVTSRVSLIDSVFSGTFSVAWTFSSSVFNQPDSTSRYCSSSIQQDHTSWTSVQTSDLSYTSKEEPNHIWSRTVQ